MPDFFAGIRTTLLRVPIIEGPFPVTVYGLALASLLLLLLRRPSRRWLVAALLGAGAGVLVAVAAWWVCVRWLNLFGTGLGHLVYFWLAVSLAGVGVGVAGLWRRGALAKTTAIVAAVASLLAGVLAINAVFGLNRTLGNLLGVVEENALPLPPPASASATPVAGELWQTWTPPPGLPQKGRISTVAVPNTASGFVARSAGLYLPPAALVDNAPRLPVVLMMMGHPGNPDPTSIAEVLDAYAANHAGLSPIVLVADQVGAAVRDTGCVDSRQDRARTYLTQDVVPWMRTHLNVLPDPRSWVVAGYSNGGQCAISLATQHPELFGTSISVSGEEFPGSENPADTLKRLFDGDAQRYEAAKPLVMMAQGRHETTTAIFTAAKDDPHYLDVARRFATGATQAGMATYLRELDRGGHVGPALSGGLQSSFGVAYPLLGLSQPGKDAVPAQNVVR